jgi:hypothetical protein
VVGVDFSSQVAGNRSALLLEAAERLDRLAGHLGETDGEPDPYGQLLRDLIADTAEFAASPDLRPLPAVSPSQATASSFRLQDRFSFWWLRIPLLLFPRRNWAFNRLEVRVEFSPQEQRADLRPKVFDILPNRRFDTVMRAGARVLLSVGADGHFSVETPEIMTPLPPVGMVSAGAGAQAQASVGAQAGFGPIQFRAVAARVDHSAEGLDKVFWRLDGAEFFQENQPELIVVLQVPREVDTATVVGVLQAYRRFNLFPAGLQAAIRQLPEALRVFFAQGAPLEARAIYDLTLPRDW